MKSGAATRRLHEEAISSLPQLRTAFPQLFGRSLASRVRRLLPLAAVFGLLAYALHRLQFSGSALVSGFDRLGLFASAMIPPATGGRFLLFVDALGQTLAIALLGTLTAAVLAFPAALLAARNIVPNVFVHFAARRGFDVIRSVDVLIWALLWINVVGLGPFAGVLAVACSDFGSFGKLFSEAIEALDRRAVDGVASAGGNRLEQVRFGLIPQVIPVIVSQVLYFFESNTRSATIIGIVGAGGIGQFLTELIRVLELGQVTTIILMILVTVTLIDFVSSRLRSALIDPSKAAEN